MLDTESCYQALRAHDPRFDGVFYVGVRTTRIYCRTVCTARTPRQDRCVFYPSAAAAERDGFRPCLRCRPELAPGSAPVDAVSRLAARAMHAIEDGAFGEEGLPELAAALGVGERHLRRVVAREFGVSPVQLAQTQRLLLAKRLLTDTALPVTEIAFASGFSSVRRFNALFQERYRMRPSDLRRPVEPAAEKPLQCQLRYQPPLDWDSLFAFVETHAMRGVEAVQGRKYLRTVARDGRRGWISAEPDPERSIVRVELSPSLAPVLRPVLARVKRLFDLYVDPTPIVERLGPLAAENPGLRVPGAFDGFELALRAILGQQVSVRAATTVAGRFVAAFGEPLETPHPELTHLTPTAARLAEADPTELAQGLPGARARSIQALAAAVVNGAISLEPEGDREATIAALKQLPGIGDWTANYVAMRALAWPDAFPHGDLGIRKALGEENPRAILQRAEAWRPWRAYAAMHLWKSLEKPR